MKTLLIKNIVIMLVFTTIILSITACKKEESKNPGYSNDLPQVLKDYIEQVMSQPVDKNLPYQIWKITIDGETYYLVPGNDCFDCFAVLYDDQGNFICGPQEGNGVGGTNCPVSVDWNAPHTVVWKDNRRS